jgi:two-component system LytT family response regulator
MSVRTLIIDDEAASVAYIEGLIRDFAPDLSVVGVAYNGVDAVQLIVEQKPDLVFIDIDMPELNGLQVLEKVPNRDFAVIFTTGYSEYAVQAFRLRAVDYLLKSIDPSEFILAVERVREFLATRQPKAVSPPVPVTSLQFPTKNGIVYLEEADIVYIDAMGAYSVLHLLNQEKITVSKNIGYIESKLSPEVFFRCHHSHIIQLQYVTRFYKKDFFYVEMKNGVSVEVSRRFKEQLLKLLSDRSR